MEKKDNIGKKSFGQSLLKRFSILALILIISCGILLCLCVNKNDSPVLAVSAATNSTTVTLEAVDDFEIDTSGKCTALSESGKEKVGDNNFIVKFPASVTQIGSTEEEKSIFEDSFKYKVVGLDFSIATQLTTIGKSAFSELTSLESVTIPKSVTTIADLAFSYCSNLQKVLLAQDGSLASVGKWAFSGCRFIAVDLPDSVTKLDTEAFGTSIITANTIERVKELQTSFGVEKKYCGLKIEMQFKKSQDDTKTEYKLALSTTSNYYSIQHQLCYNDGMWAINSNYALPYSEDGCWFGSYSGSGETNYDCDTINTLLDLDQAIQRGKTTLVFTFKPFLTTADPTLALENNQLIFKRVAQVPQIKTTLDANTDFDILYYSKGVGAADKKVESSQIINVGSYYVELTGKGNYCGKTKLDFTIEKASLTGATIVLDSEDTSWKGPNTQIKLGVQTVTTSAEQNSVLLLSNEYTVSYSSTKGLSEYGSEITVTVKANNDSSFKDSATTTYTITARSIENVTVTGYENKTYTGESITFDDELQVVDNGINYRLENETDYNIVYERNKDVGTATIKIVGQNSYEGTTKEVHFQINAAALPDTARVELNQNVTYDGKSHRNIVKNVYIGSKPLYNDEYTVNYYRNGDELDYDNYELTNIDFILAGVIDVKITATKNYTGTLTAQYEIYQLDISTLEIVYSNESVLTYNGKEQKKQAYLRFSTDIQTASSHGAGGKLEQTFERISGEGGSDNFINAGTFKVTFKGSENLKGEKSYTYQILPRDIEASSIGIKYTGQQSYTKDNSLEIDYTGEPISVLMRVTLGPDLQEGTDFTVKYSDDHTNVGTVTITITGKGNYTGENSTTFKINPIMMEYVTLNSNVKYNRQSYEGQIIKAVGARSNGDTITNLVEGRDYKIYYRRNGVETDDFTNAGTIEVEVEGINNCTKVNSDPHYLKREFKISAIEMTQDNTDIALQNIDLTWRNEDIKPAVVSITLHDDINFELLPTEYEVIYPEGSLNSVGYVTINIKTKGDNFTGESSTYYQIKQRDLNETNLTIKGIEEKTYYTGREIKFDNITFVDNFGDERTYTLQLLTDYSSSITYSDNINVGQATIKIKGTGHYTGEKEFHFEIMQRPIDKIMLSKDSVTYDGYDHKNFWAATAMDQLIYESNTETCDVVYKRNGVVTTDYAHAGIITVEVTGKGNYCGFVTINYEIKRASIESGRLSLNKSDDTAWNNKDTHRSITLELYFRGNYIYLNEGTDFDAIYKRISGGDPNDIKNVGTIQLTVKGREDGNFEGELSTTYEITPRKINKDDQKFSFTRVDSNDHFTYTGEEIKITDYTFKYDDYTLVLDKDYEEKYDNNVDATGGLYTWLQLIGKGNFSGIYIYSFIIDPADITDLEIEVDEETYPFFVGQSTMYHNAKVKDNKYKGYFTFDEINLKEADMYRSDPITLNWTFKPESNNYNLVHGTYTIQRGVFIRVTVYFDEQKLQSMTVGDELDFGISAYKDGDDGTSPLTDGYSVIVTNSLGKVVNSLDEVGQYFVEVKTDNPKYMIDTTAKREFYVKVKDIVSNDDSGIKASSDKGFEAGVQLIHEEINEEYRMREILGNNYSDKVHHIEYISFEKDGHTINLDNVKIFLENNENYDVFMYVAESMPYMTTSALNVSSLAPINNNGSMINITDLIRNNQPFNFSGTGVYLVFQIAEHGSNSQSGANKSSSNLIIFIAIGAVALVAIIATSIVIVKIRKKKKLKSMM